MWLLILREAVLQTENIPDTKVYVAIRPEGFIPDPKGKMHCTMSRIEVMGRDTSIISGNPASLDTNVRAIVNDTVVDPSAREISFSLKQNKVFVFDRNTEERIPCSFFAIGGENG